MSTKDWIFLFLITTIIFMFGMIAGAEIGLENYKAISACEAELPRNERCIVIAVPEKGE